MVLHKRERRSTAGSQSNHTKLSGEIQPGGEGQEGLRVEG